jgi:hypothetical protein
MIYLKKRPEKAIRSIVEYPNEHSSYLLQLWSKLIENSRANCLEYKTIEEHFYSKSKNG